MRDRQTCIGCGKKSPETETNYTLISAQFGWRLTRYKAVDGAIVIEWRCPTCWKDFKKTKGGDVDGTAPAPPRVNESLRSTGTFQSASPTPTPRPAAPIEPDDSTPPPPSTGRPRSR